MAKRGRAVSEFPENFLNDVALYDPMTRSRIIKLMQVNETYKDDMVERLIYSKLNTIS